MRLLYVEPGFADPHTHELLETDGGFMRPAPLTNDDQGLGHAGEAFALDATSGKEPA